MLERPGGGHADEEKSQTIPDQADRRHFGAEVTGAPAGVDTSRDLRDGRSETLVEVCIYTKTKPLLFRKEAVATSACK